MITKLERRIKIKYRVRNKISVVPEILLRTLYLILITQ